MTTSKGKSKNNKDLSDDHSFVKEVMRAARAAQRDAAKENARWGLPLIVTNSPQKSPASKRK